MNVQNKNAHSEQFLYVISFEALYKAHRRARKNKRFKKEVIQFELELSKNLWALHYDLLYGKYKMDGYHKFMIYDPKEREIQAISYRDRVVQHSICDNFLTPLLEKNLVFYNVACRKKKGTSCAVNALKRFISEHYSKFGKKGYFLKADIKKYFNSIDHCVLKRMLRKLNMPEDMLKLLFLIIDSYFVCPQKGLPMGNQTSQCFALLYLNGIDRLFKEELSVKFYLRYMDDLIAIFSVKKSARTALLLLSEKINKQKLSLNKKSQIINFSNGVEFLGRRFFIGKNSAAIEKLTKSTKKRVHKRVLKNIFMVKSGNKGADFLLKSARSYKGFFLRCNAYLYLQKLIFQLYSYKKIKIN